jgi:hypothetical protein
MPEVDPRHRRGRFRRGGTSHESFPRILATRPGVQRRSAAAGALVTSFVLAIALAISLAFASYQAVLDDFRTDLHFTQRLRQYRAQRSGDQEEPGQKHIEVIRQLNGQPADDHRWKNLSPVAAYPAHANAVA